MALINDLPGQEIIFLHGEKVERNKSDALKKLKSMSLSYGEPAVVKYYAKSRGTDIALMFGIGTGNGNVYVIESWDGSDVNIPGIDKLTEGTAISIDNLIDGRRKISVNVSPNENNLLRTDDYGDLIVDKTTIGYETDTYSKKEIDQKFSAVNTSINDLSSRIESIDGGEW